MDPHTTADPAATAARPANPPAAAPPRRRRWWLRPGWLLLIAIAAAVYFAPAGVARYVETNGWTLTGEDGTRFRVRAEDVTLGWFSPVRLADVRIDDEAGQPLLTAPQIVSQRSLAAITADRTSPGRFFINEPNLNVVVRRDGSNLEDFLSIFDRDKSRGRARALTIGATISHGLISFTDADGNPLVKIDEIDCRGQQQHGTDFQVEIDLSAHIVSEGEQRAIEASLRWEGPGEGLPFLSGTGTAGFTFDPLPLTILKPHLARVAPALVIDAGTLSGRLLVESDFREGRALTASGEFVTRDVQGVQASADGARTPFAWEQEPLSFHVDGRYDPQAQTLDIADLKLQSTPLSVSATGSVTDLAGECLLDVGGDLQYDVAGLVQTLAGDSAGHVQIEGLRTRAFAITGPLATLVNGTAVWDLSRLNASAQINWDRADVFGVHSDAATIAARLEDGTLLIEPVEVPVSGGHFRTRSLVELSGADAAARIAAGPALENVEFSEAMCHLWLKYLSPVLADATRVNGRFSIQLSEGRFPLRDAASGHIAGELDVKSAAVRPGPFAEQVIGVIASIRSLIDTKAAREPADRALVTMPPQRVKFEMSDRQVRHEPMQFVVAGAVIRSSGSVGLDESLDLLIEIPLETKWFKSDLLASTLGGEVIRIPVRGTLSRPQFELSALRDLTARVAAGAAGSLLQKLLD